MNVIDFENDSAIDLNMSSLQGTIKTTYAKLVEIFGKPTHNDSDPYEKVNCEWMVEASVQRPDDWNGDSFWEEDTGGHIDYVPFSIYNWKTGYVPTEEYEWHIGGFDMEAVDVATAIINGKS